MTKIVDQDARYAVRWLDANGAPVIGLTSASGGADLSFYQLTQTGLVKTAFTPAASGDYEMRELGDGWYDFLIPDDGASADNNVVGTCWVDGKFSSTAASQPVIEEVLNTANSDKLDAYWGQVRTGTAQAGGASTITLAAAEDAADNFLVGWTILITEGTGAGQVRRVTSNANNGDIVTVHRAWDTQPDATSVYQLHPIAQPSVFLEDNAISETKIATAAFERIADWVLTRDWTAVALTAARFSVLNKLRFLFTRTVIDEANDLATVYEEDDVTEAYSLPMTFASGDAVRGVDPT